jgi:hypothetical protein
MKCGLRFEMDRIECSEATARHLYLDVCYFFALELMAVKFVLRRLVATPRLIPCFLPG